MSINSKTNQQIITDDIIAQDTEDIVLACKNSWQLIDKKDIEEETSLTIEETLPTTSDVDQIQNDLPETRSRILYTFGLKNICPEYKSYNAVSGIVSNPIAITNTRYIEIEADITEAPNSSVEFSIIDGNTEYPILPGSLTQVTQEKLFYNLPTRFDIDASHTVTIYQDGKEYASSYNDFDQELLQDTTHTYTITYTPINPYRLTVLNTSIRLKVIIRVYDGGYPPLVTNIAVQKSGGTLQWQI